MAEVDAIGAFFKLLVEPMVFGVYNPHMITVPLKKQQSVAQQVYAVVLLYNYYYRKTHLNLNHLDFKSFCELALTLKPNLRPYFKWFLISDDIEVSNIEKQELSLTEQAIKDACDVCTSLDASRDVPNIKGWPVSRVAVLLIDEKKENCVLQNDSITEGVWSVIEKKVDEIGCSSEEKHGNKRQRTLDLQDESDEHGLDKQLAFSAVREATKNGIDEKDLTIIESHVVYSLDKEKAATRFYIMHCHHNGAIDSSEWLPIQEVIDCLQGPLVIKASSSNTWEHSSVVEYFHLLHYAQIISDWFSRQVRLQDGEPVQEGVSLNGSQKTEKPDEHEVLNDKTPIQIGDDLEEAFINTASAEVEMLVKNSAKLRQVLASKGQKLSETALNVLYYKRDILALKQPEIGDEIARCNQMIQKFLKGADDHDLELKLDVVIQGCNTLSERAHSKQNPSQASWRSK
ncbi:hypothetical protein CCACVL1_19205 [Corchorus capsularis]|uniref:Uncharacterized protein n=1 Tax=Corchorus capsularis TaxID=210143 RepID=A0A1R3HHY6_COCAP|nr:hypothetical protein CCACVL1_19205 [Corchorus capsularis]